nr:Chain B, Neurexin-2-beta Peptide [Homo sapiens]
NKDKEYYV